MRNFLTASAVTYMINMYQVRIIFLFADTQNGARIYKSCNESWNATIYFMNVCRQVTDANKLYVQR